MQINLKIKIKIDGKVLASISTMIVALIQFLELKK